MQTPRTDCLSEDARAAARFVAEMLRDRGLRGWIVGGAVRDLALGRQPTDIDMCSAATPSQIEDWFGSTHAVGRAFGTVVVRAGGLDLQLTTFRKEAGYSDERRPDRVEFGVSLERDARRRDFTCNAIYLDPLNDEICDPEGGLGDLQSGILRCVGRAADRFREDGLRLLRLARLAARYGLQVDDEAAEAARAEGAALRGVSVERVLGELLGMLARPGSARAIGMLIDLDLMPRAIPGWEQLSSSHRARLEVLQALVDPPGAEPGLAVLLGIDPREASAVPDSGLAEQLLRDLRPPKKLLTRVLEIESIVREVLVQAEAESEARRSRASAIRLIRAAAWAPALAVARAWCRVGNLDTERLDRLEALSNSLPQSELFPEALLTAAELMRAGVEQGPRLGELLFELEAAQLDQDVHSAAEALQWLEQRLRE